MSKFKTKKVWDEKNEQWITLTPEMQEEAWRVFRILKDAQREQRRLLLLIREHQLYRKWGYETFEKFIIKEGKFESLEEFDNFCSNPNLDKSIEAEILEVEAMARNN